MPDLELFAAQFHGVRNVRFHAALEFGMQHLALVVSRRAAPDRLATSGTSAGPSGWEAGRTCSMGPRETRAACASASPATRADGARVRRTWQLTAPALNGPEIPSMAAIVLARRFSRGEVPAPGAMPCMGLLALADFEPEFARWGIVTRIEETAG